MAKVKFDFSGYATKNNVRCSDGRVIRKDAFSDNDGITVPLVWQHIHDDPNNVLGHALLENREDGVYAYCSFNETEAGKSSKLLVSHGDIKALSIYAKELKQQGTNVLHGAIKEVSLVLAGANPEALIDNLSFQHGDELEEIADEAIIYTGELFSTKEIEHSVDDSEETMQDVLDTLTDKQMDVVNAIIGEALDDGTAEHSDVPASDDPEETVQDVFDTLSDKQKNVVYAILADALDTESADAAHSDIYEEDEDLINNPNGDKIAHSNGGGTTMKKNVFDQSANTNNQVTLSHSEVSSIFADARKTGSLKEAFFANEATMAHIQTYGIENIDFLFPDARIVNGVPEVIKRDDVWVEAVLSASNHSPFSRIKSTAVDITADEARARGYMKGGLKKDEVIKLLKRVTTPQTIYKKQKLDRDDIVDITDLDIVAWLKAEMRVMLNEEIARAILVGDGRSEASEDKINSDNIRPIYLDEGLYAPKVDVSAEPEAMVDDILRARAQYKGSGNPTFYTAQANLIEMLLVRDTTGRKIYTNVSELCLALGVSNIVEVPVMEGVSRMGTESTPLQHDLIGIIVNLKDYTVGADKGGAINMFDDFDIDYNQQKYLIETRCSGALTKPYSAIVIEKLHA